MPDMDYPHQFVLSQATQAWKDGWQQFSHRRFVLQADPSLPVREVIDEKGALIGFVVGWPIDPSGTMPKKILQVPFETLRDNGKRLEAYIYQFGGRFAFIILGKRIKRVYLDPGATLGLVFSKNGEIAGSSLSILALHDPKNLVWSTPRGEFPDNGPNRYFPAGLTLDQHVRRLLPNHYLDLHSWQSLRHYPDHPLEPITKAGIKRSIEKIADQLRKNILAVVEHKPRVYMPLTAGYDSRMLLACSRDSADRIEFVTFDYTPMGTARSFRVDLQIAKRLARCYGLNHHVLPVTPPFSEEMKMAYLRRIGFSGGSGKSIDFFSTCRKYLDMSAAWLPGFAGEVGRARYRQPENETLDSISPEKLLKYMRLPLSDTFIQAITAWLNGFPTELVPTILDFFYLENRVGAWASPHLYGTAPFSMLLVPFCHRRIFELMLRLPTDYKRKEGMARDIIFTAWPPLLDLPFNNYTGIAGIWKHVRWKLGSKYK